MIQTDYSTLTIENHRMYARLRDHQFSLYEDYARKRGLQGKSLLILLWIYRHPKGISQQTITRHTYSTKQVVNAVIKNFSKLIMLTEKGRQFAASIIDPMDEAEKKAFSQLSAKQQQTLIETTHLFTDVLTQEFMRLIKEICPNI